MPLSHSIGWIGAGGRLGFSMAKRLLKAGCDVSVYNRTRSKVEPLAGLGATIVDSPRDLCGKAIVFSTVSASDDLIEIALGPNGVLGGDESPELLVDCSTVSEEASATVREAAARRGTAMLSAPVSGNAKVVSAGKLTIVASGPRAAYDAAEPYLAAIGTGVTYVGEGELSRMVKICHNLMLGVVAQCLAEITVLAEKRGVSRHDFLEFLNDSVVGSMFTRYKSPAFVNLDMTPTFTPVLLRKDLDLGLQAAEKLGVPLPVTAVTRKLVNDAVEAGHTECDFAILLDLQAKASGLDLKAENVEVDDGLD
ncbi:NAD(P)-dependent oxidoreductase [Candidatus Rariloculus sp.]|uniref:NAD(P)-dependent oxidoreductase n=1 Tax=Candidatus Rariloculus sp. TaxID=3101265 RepID=UPI003D12B7AA